MGVSSLTTISTASDAAQQKRLRPVPTADAIAEAIRLAARGPPAGAFTRPPPGPVFDERFVIDEEGGGGGEGAEEREGEGEEEDFDEVSLGSADGGSLYPPEEYLAEEEDETGTAAFDALRMLGAFNAGNGMTASALVELLHASGRKEGCRLSRREARVAVRMAHRLARQHYRTFVSSESSAIATAKTPEALLIGLASDRSLPWYVREEALLCLESRVKAAAAAPAPATQRSPLSSSDWDSVLSLVEGGPSRHDDAAVRSAAVRVVVSHGRHRRRQTLGRLRALSAERESEPEPRAPVAGWHDGDRLVQLARASLGDASAFVAAVVRRYDPQEEQRAEAREALRAAARVFGEGMAGVARRIVAEDEVENERGEVPDLGGHPRRVWKFLMDQHWNECVVRWAGEELKEVDASQRRSADKVGL